MRQFFAPFLLFNFVFCTAAWPIGGPAQTKRERLAMERSHGGIATRSGPAVARVQLISPASNTGLREEIERSFLSEDYLSAEKLAGEYLAGPVDPKDMRDVSMVRALCLLKLRRTQESKDILEKLLPGSANEVERSRIVAALAQAQPALAQPAVPERVSAAVQAVPASSPTVSHQQIVEEIPRYSVQVGSFSKEKNARSLLHQLAERHYNAFIEHRADALYRVKVGPIGSLEQALNTEGQLKKDGYPTKICP